MQDAGTGQVLMVAHMNEEAYAATLRSGRATFFSRSRGRLWEKGETSGNSMRVLEVRLDCDGDAVLLRVDPPVPPAIPGTVRASARRAARAPRPAPAGPPTTG